MPNHTVIAINIDSILGQTINSTLLGYVYGKPSLNFGNRLLSKIFKRQVELSLNDFVGISRPYLKRAMATLLKNETITISEDCLAKIKAYTRDLADVVLYSNTFDFLIDVLTDHYNIQYHSCIASEGHTINEIIQEAALLKIGDVEALIRKKYACPVEIINMEDGLVDYKPVRLSATKCVPAVVEL